MAANETRLLMLGAVKLFAPVNGYQIRRELISWEVEDWAHLRPGSIYSVLGTLARQGMLARHEVPEGSRHVAVYTLTPAGDGEFRRLFAAAVTAADRSSPTAFHTAVALLPLVPRADFLTWLTARIDTIAARRAGAAARYANAGAVPGHVAELAGLWERTDAVDESWCRALRARVAAGELHFAGERMDWRPDADDPGWQMHRDRAHYLRVLNLP
ncbi:PadR family transcriptional regulator [Pilimelia terevasa]|uniref:PadR family transcriptional regulator n=1 Tax=Pilimelia terevasa TaxID=53372 RepID=UPI00166A22A8|nr:PadR family transcriptional regulator [Pilimelia terevasa]